MRSPGLIRWIHATTDRFNHDVFGAHHSIGMVGGASVRARGDVPFDWFGSLGQAAPGFDSHGAADISAAGPYGHHNGCSGDSWSDRSPHTGTRALCGYVPGDFARVAVSRKCTGVNPQSDDRRTSCYALAHEGAHSGGVFDSNASCGTPLIRRSAASLELLVAA